MYRVGLLTLGCKVNTCESEQIREKLTEAGFETVDFEKKADVYIINTCSVTNIADRKSRQMLHKARKNNPDAVIVATGCYAQINGRKVADAMDADIVVGNNHKSEIAEILKKYLDGGKSNIAEESKAAGEGSRGTMKNNGNSASEENDCEIHNSAVPDMDEKKLQQCSFVCVDRIEEDLRFEPMELNEFPEKSRAFIKIEDGCNQFCSYCIIPYTRGRVRSRTMGSILKETESLAASGIKEIVLTGIHLSSYGRKNYEAGMKNESEEFNFGPLLELIRKIAEVKGIERIRLGSLEPRIISEEFAGRLREITKFCPHFHLALQSGSDTVLRRMNRHYTTDEFYEKCVLLRKVFDNPAITTDIITGFPGETEEEFAESLGYYEKVGFAKMHVFKFSRRAGTVADRMPGQLQESVKHERSLRVIALDERLHRAYMEGFVGSVQEVLIEEINEGLCKGLISRYIPVVFRGEKDSRVNDIVKVKITGVRDIENLQGEQFFYIIGNCVL